MECVVDDAILQRTAVCDSDITRLSLHVCVICIPPGMHISAAQEEYIICHRFTLNYWAASHRNSASGPFFKAEFRVWSVRPLVTSVHCGKTANSNKMKFEMMSMG